MNINFNSEFALGCFMCFVALAIVGTVIYCVVTEIREEKRKDRWYLENGFIYRPGGWIKLESK